MGETGWSNRNKRRKWDEGGNEGRSVSTLPDYGTLQLFSRDCACVLHVLVLILNRLYQNTGHFSGPGRATGPASMSVRLCDCLCPKITIALQMYHSPPRLSQFTGNLLGLDSTRSKSIGTDSAFRLPCNDRHSCLDTHT